MFFSIIFAFGFYRNVKSLDKIINNIANGIAYNFATQLSHPVALTFKFNLKNISTIKGIMNREYYEMNIVKFGQM